MPSVGGGGSGGGFHGGSFGGGGSYGGGGYRGGGFYGGFFGFRRRSILGSLISAILSPIIFCLVGIICIVVFFTIVGKPGTKTINYDEDTFQKYAFEKYYDLYGNSEDDVLFVFLASENPETDGYYQISICGDNLKASVTNMFGNNNTVFGGEMDRMLPDNYLNSMLPAIRSATESTAIEINNLGTPDKYYYSLPTGARNRAQFINKADYLNVNTEYAQKALDEFYEDTDVVLSIYVDDVNNVFKRTNFAWIVLVVGIVFTAIGGFLIFGAIKVIKAYRERKNGGSSGSNGSSGSSNGSSGGSDGPSDDLFRSSSHTDRGGTYY